MAFPASMRGFSGDSNRLVFLLIAKLLSCRPGAGPSRLTPIRRSASPLPACRAKVVLES